MRSSDLAMRLELIRQLEIQKKELTEQLEALKDSVKAEMSQKNTDEIFLGDHSVSWKSYTTHRFNTMAFKAQHGDLFNQFNEAVEVRRFIVR